MGTQGGRRWDTTHPDEGWTGTFTKCRGERRTIIFKRREGFLVKSGSYERERTAPTNKTSPRRWQKQLRMVLKSCFVGVSPLGKTVPKRRTPYLKDGFKRWRSTPTKIRLLYLRFREKNGWQDRLSRKIHFEGPRLHVRLVTEEELRGVLGSSPSCSTPRTTIFDLSPVLGPRDTYRPDLPGSSSSPVFSSVCPLALWTEEE